MIALVVSLFVLSVLGSMIAAALRMRNIVKDVIADAPDEDEFF